MKKLLSTTAMAVVLATQSLGLAHAQEEELRRVIEQQQQELETLKQRYERMENDSWSVRQDIDAIHEAREETEAVLGTAVTRGDHPGSFKIPGTNTSVKIGGYVKADFIYDVDADLGDSFAASAIPADGSDADRKSGNFRSHAKQTRLNFSTWTPTEVGEVKLFIEGDFFGQGGNQTFSNSTTFRLRHAFGEIGPVLAGQTWTLFMPLTSYPETVDFFGPAGIPFVRQGQLRYTHKIDDAWSVAGSIENSELSARTLDGTTVGADGGDLRFGVDTLPDFVAAVSYDNDGWHGRLAGVGRLLDTEAAGSDDRTFGWGLTASAVVPTFGEDSFQANFTYGDGIGRYIINGFNQDAFIDDDGDLDTISSWGLALGYTHHWNSTFRSNLVYGRYQVLDTNLATDTESLDTVHANLIWEPDPKLRFGVEYIFGRRAFDDGGLDNTAHRVQLAAQFLF
jgi:hypothetical protein